MAERFNTASDLDAVYEKRARRGDSEYDNFVEKIKSSSNKVYGDSKRICNDLHLSDLKEQEDKDSPADKENDSEGARNNTGGYSGMGDAFKISEDMVADMAVDDHDVSGADNSGGERLSSPASERKYVSHVILKLSEQDTETLSKRKWKYRWDMPAFDSAFATWMGSGESLLKRCKIVETEDRISKLPDELISHILSGFTMKEAVATTSILSRRWRYLWTLCPNLDFEGLDGFNVDFGIYENLLKKEKLFVQAIDRTVECYDGPKLNVFRLVFPFVDSNSVSHIDSWIFFAILHGVSRLDLNFNRFASGGHPINYYFPARVFLREKTIDHSRHCSALPTTPCRAPLEMHFESLTVLSLRSINLSDDLFELILSKFVSLEKFLLMFSYGLVFAKNTDPCLSLKSLELYFCKDLQKLQLLAPNLVSFMYQGSQRSICIKNSQKLGNVKLLTDGVDCSTNLTDPQGEDLIFGQFSSYLPQIESLIISVRLFKGMRDLAELPVFRNLNTLALHFPLESSLVPMGCRTAVSILKTAPNLRLIVLHLHGGYLQTDALELTPMIHHQNLKEVKVVGFRADQNILDLITYLLKSANSLQKVDISARRCLSIGDNCGMWSELDWLKGEASKCKRFVERLRQRLPSNVELIYNGEVLVWKCKVKG